MSDIDDDQSNLDLGSVFTEPSRPPTPEPTIAVYDRELASETSVEFDTSTLNSWKSVRIRLVGSHPLWGHYLWNAARAFASFLDINQHLTKDRYVLELGAGGALPSIVAALNGARQAVITDYPDADLIRNMEFNVSENLAAAAQQGVSVEGYIWGHPVQRLFSSLPSGKKFDLIILSDLVFNHSQHEALLNTCEDALDSHDDESSSGASDNTSTPCILVFYTHHRPKLAHKDMEIFDKARARGWVCEQVLKRKYPPMFPEDPGEVEVRSTVHGWRLVRQ